jgi:hypothetical protein
MRKGLNRDSEGKKWVKDNVLGPLASRFLTFSFSISSLLVNAFLLRKLRVFNTLSKHQNTDFQYWPKRKAHSASLAKCAFMSMFQVNEPKGRYTCVVATNSFSG